jgi:hypothetical protein
MKDKNTKVEAGYSILHFIFDLISDLFGSAGQSDSINTQKVDRNIARLNEHDWFKDIYSDEKYRRLFFVNRHIRAHLQSSLRVNRMIRDLDARERFLLLLDKHLK